MDPVQLPWRTGGRRGRTIHVQLRADPSDGDPFAGLIDTPELAAEAVFAQAGSEPAQADVIVCVAAAPEIAVLVCELHNAGLAVQPGTYEVNRLIREHLAADRAGGGRR